MDFRRIVTLATAVLLLGVIVGVVAFSQRQSESYALSGEFKDFLESHLGEVLVLDIMNTDCPACVIETGHLRELQRDYGEEIVVISLSIEFGVFEKDTNKKIETFRQEYGVDWTIKTYENATEIIRRFSVYGIPTTIVFDQDGEIVFQTTGIVGSDQIASVAEPLLGED